MFTVRARPSTCMKEVEDETTLSNCDCAQSVLSVSELQRSDAWQVNTLPPAQGACSGTTEAPGRGQSHQTDQNLHQPEQCYLPVAGNKPRSYGYDPYCSHFNNSLFSRGVKVLSATVSTSLLPSA